VEDKKTVRAGIVGAGFAASFHFEALRKVYGTNVEIVGVFTPFREEREAFARQRSIRPFDTLEGLIDGVDVVHACVPPAVHEEIALAALSKNKSVIVEKPLTGFFGDGSEGFRGDSFPKAEARRAAMASVRRILEAENGSRGRVLYAENWLYAPAIRKECEIIEKTAAQVLWMHGEEAHSGSHSKTYGYWKHSGGGSMIGKGCHPLTAALFLKRLEGACRLGRAIRPRTVSARTHELTRLPGFTDEGHLRTDYHDVEDFAMMHVVFDDGTIADIIASEIVMGGVHNWLEVVADNHRTICNINPNNAMQTYNPTDESFRDIYVVEKLGSKQGWLTPSPDEDWFTGYPQEMEAFYRTVAYGAPLDSDSMLAADTISTIYSAYVSAEKDGAEVEIEQLHGGEDDHGKGD
jgi:predicted dehydrogenase